MAKGFIEQPKRAKEIVFDGDGNPVNFNFDMQVSEQALRIHGSNKNLLMGVKLKDPDLMFGWIVETDPSTAMKIQSEEWRFATREDIEIAPFDRGHLSPEGHICVRELALVVRPKSLHDELNYLNWRDAMSVLKKEHDSVNEKMERLGAEMTMDISEDVVHSKEALRQIQKDYAKDQMPSKKKVYDMSPNNQEDVLV